MTTLIENLLLALTDTQCDKVLAMIERGFLAIEQAVRTLWITLSPLLLGYLAYRQAQNRREITGKIDSNTEVSVKAFEVANSHNEKIAAVVEYVKPKPTISE